jgi:hypothetical protein
MCDDWSKLRVIEDIEMLNVYLRPLDVEPGDELFRIEYFRAMKVICR